MYKMYNDSIIYIKGYFKFLLYRYCILNQYCGAGAGGAEIILGPGAGAENKF